MGIIKTVLENPKLSLLPNFPFLSSGTISENLMNRFRNKSKSVDFGPKNGTFTTFLAKHEFFLEKKALLLFSVY